jgi:hypothetical protein
LFYLVVSLSIINRLLNMDDVPVALLITLLGDKTAKVKNINP